jgi:hypothetical protein
MKFTAEQVMNISKGDAEIASFITFLLEQNAKLENQVRKLEKQNEKLEGRVKELERQLAARAIIAANHPQAMGFANPKAYVYRVGKRAESRVMRGQPCVLWIIPMSPSDTECRRANVAKSPWTTAPCCGKNGAKYSTWLRYRFKHALCGAHLLRECQGILDYDGQVWAEAMQALLQRACHEAKEARYLDEGWVSVLHQQQMVQAYDEILIQGEAENPGSPGLPTETKRGRKAKSKAQNLLARFSVYKTEILRFLHDPRVPFDNNQAERDIRMVKVKLKISGAFRTREGAELFARIRGFISTLRKQNLNLLQSLHPSQSRSVFISIVRVPE